MADEPPTCIQIDRRLVRHFENGGSAHDPFCMLDPQSIRARPPFTKSSMRWMHNHVTMGLTKNKSVAAMPMKRLDRIAQFCFSVTQLSKGTVRIPLSVWGLGHQNVIAKILFLFSHIHTPVPYRKCMPAHGHDKFCLPCRMTSKMTFHGDDNTVIAKILFLFSHIHTPVPYRKCMPAHEHDKFCLPCRMTSKMTFHGDDNTSPPPPPLVFFV